MIPVCEPYLPGNELEYVIECIKSNWISSKGKYIEEFETKFANYCDCRYGISTTSGTTALHLAVASLGIGEGDEVIIPTFTMAATAFAIFYTGAKPVLVDSEPETWNINPEKIEEKITENTKAVMPVHIYGHPVDMDPILEIAEEHDLYIIEDAAEANGARYKNRITGSLGDCAAFSFYTNKMITTGEGGMMVTDNEDIAGRARALEDMAFSKERRFLHTDIGFNYRMTNIQAAIGLAQLERIDDFVEMRRKNARLYSSLLEEVNGIRLPIEKDYVKNVYWMYSILIEDSHTMVRDEFMKQLENKGIETRTFFIPMHEQPVFHKKKMFIGESYPVAENIAKQGLYLPSGTAIKKEEIEYVCNTIKDILEE